MPVLKTILIIVLIYVFLVFFLSRIIFPFLRFKRYPIPPRLPIEMDKTIQKLKKDSKNKMDFLESAYSFLTNIFYGGSLTTMIRIDRLLICDLEKIWGKKGYVPCATFNHLIRIFLIRSGEFKEEDIKIKTTMVLFNIHQYLKVNVDGKWIDVDPTGDHFGFPFGTHVTYFPLNSLPRLLRRRREAKRNSK